MSFVPLQPDDTFIPIHHFQQQDYLEQQPLHQLNSSTGCQRSIESTPSENNFNPNTDLQATATGSWNEAYTAHIHDQQHFFSSITNDSGCDVSQRILTSAKPFALPDQGLPVYNDQAFSNFTYRPVHTLTQTPSTTSLRSLTSTDYSSDSYRNPTAYLDGVNLPYTPHELSRQSSFSSLGQPFNDSTFCDLGFGSQTTVDPIMISPQKSVTQLISNNEHHHGSSRSLGRPAPYRLHSRSDSLTSIQ
jgi:hypothetical protein